jgi:quinol monooxygenase YgiN
MEGTMYGTIAKLAAKTGAIKTLRQIEKGRKPAGFISSYVFQSDQDPNELWLIAIFESKAAYMANADSPEQDKEFKKLKKFLSAEPEWHDGEIVFANEG